MEITLTQLVGQMAPTGKVEVVHHAVDRVLLDGRHVGWLGRHDNARFVPIVKLDELTTRKLVARLGELRNADGFQVDATAAGEPPGDEAVREAKAKLGIEEDDDE